MELLWRHDSMASENAIRDQNHVPTKLAVLNTDTVQGTNKVRIAIDSVTGGMKTDTTSTISFTMVPVDAQDENYVDCWLAVSSVDGLTYPLVATSDGAVLVDE